MIIKLHQSHLKKKIDAERGSTPIGDGIDHEKDVAEWQNILSEIIIGFEFYCGDDYHEFDPICIEKIKRSTELFGKYMMYLWL